MREQVHGQRRHAHVRFAARHTLLGRLRIQTAMRLLVSRQIGRGGVLLTALRTRVFWSLVAVRIATYHCHVVHRARDRFLFGATVADEESFVRVGDGLRRGWFGW